MTAHTDELADPVFVDDRLAHWAEANPDGEACHLPRPHAGRGREWNDRVAAWRAHCRQLGIGRGDVVSFLDKNHPACVELTLAAASPRCGQRDRQLPARG